ncbi:metal ABC transporter ATP-binding protein [Proteocatella sphenisci]|uniref:metal ABC transporter ATP-binding protein n=1 Tax=Proteocatella sphenisci TaxID=181070 RepID=UPI0004915F88|nr:metal ABC transporter ATP-binding protein [Proteocatella sphenisci]
MALIDCRNISLSYENNVVISDLSFKVCQGDYICIAGENGSGKSTMLKSMLSLKDLSDGEIIFGDGLQKNEVGYLPQQTDIQKDFPASVWEIVLSGCLNSRGLRPFYSKSDKAKAKNNIEKLSIGHLISAPYNELSGGQQQRVLLARALCATKKILLLDEPVSGLDPLVTAELYQIIKGINDEGITIVMVSHDVKTAVKFASHILHLRNKSGFFGTKEDYIKSREYKIFMGGAEID